MMLEVASSSVNNLIDELLPNAILVACSGLNVERALNLYPSLYIPQQCEVLPVVASVDRWLE